MPNDMPPAPPLAVAGPPPRAEVTGRLTTFPPSGSPVSPLIGRRPRSDAAPAGRFGGPNTPSTGTVPAGRLLGWLVNPRPTTIDRVFDRATPPPPHRTPRPKGSARPRTSI